MKHPSTGPGTPMENLLIAVLRDGGQLAGAACVGLEWLFDARDHDENEQPDEVAYRHGRAAELCRTCPVLTACHDWADTLDPNDVLGVVAGELRAPPKSHRSARQKSPAA